MKRSIPFCGAFLAILIPLLTACGTYYEEPPVREVLRYPRVLQARISSENAVWKYGEDIRVTVRYTNVGPEVLGFFQHTLSMDQALDVHAAPSGRKLPELPAPPPLTEEQLPAYRTALAPGEVLEKTYILPVDPQFMTPGDYLIRVGPVDSDDLKLTVVE